MKPDLEAQLNRLPSLETGELRKLWRELFQNPPHPKLRRELLIPILAYRLQEKALGGMNPSIARRLRTIADELASGKRSPRSSQLAPRPGTRMVRQWQGKLHEVISLGERLHVRRGKVPEASRKLLAGHHSGPDGPGPAFSRIEEALRPRRQRDASHQVRQVYTRKSSEEGLEQSFNSLDAQREACEAYIRSQKHEGWVGLTTKYDDGGFSEGNIEGAAVALEKADGRYQRRSGKVNIGRCLHG